MANLPPQDKPQEKPIGKSLDNPPANTSQTFPVATFIVNFAVLGASAIAGIGIGLAIAFMRPDLVWQPSLSFLDSYKRQQFTLLADSLFDVDKANIRPESFRLLDEVAAKLPLTKGKRLRINGHMDLSTVGDELTLSYLRASAVKEYLARLRGEQSYYWMVIGYGASRPLANSAGDNKSNRRIEIVVED